MPYCIITIEKLNKLFIDFYSKIIRSQSVILRTRNCDETHKTLTTVLTAEC